MRDISFKCDGEASSGGKPSPSHSLGSATASDRCHHKEEDAKWFSFIIKYTKKFNKILAMLVEDSWKNNPKKSTKAHTKILSRPYR